MNINTSIIFFWHKNFKIEKLPKKKIPHPKKNNIFDKGNGDEG